MPSSALFISAATLHWACAAAQAPGTPMHAACRELPTIEECRAAARSITDECLRECVSLQCGGAKINCGADVKKECALRKGTGVSALGYVWRPADAGCQNPVSEVNWCEEPSSRECRAQAMVHELAHACGWKHRQGLGVPADDGDLRCE
ncbi:hypothetical protein [Corallococcus carmarthensis]|uniref:hypothetical protein n=1 Tax=Corallococcus carmarthensis TaxID=2316728 RepID=UPI00148DB52B|nr:hypothetical protein [Corallococcus carmarthensis]NOK21969.1 hypothetical protein [Corallococcus carmarthensis]